MATNNETKTTLDYRAFLADLEAKRAALDQAIVSVRGLIASGAQAVNPGESAPGMADSVSVALHGGEIPAGAFLGMSIPEAAKLYLSIVRAKQTAREIADAMLKGGMETTSKNFEGIVAAGINRASKKDGEIVRVGRGWALAAWYPAGIRAAAQGKRNGRKARKSRKQKSARGTAMAAALESSVENNGHKKPQERIAEFLRGNPTKSYTSQQVSQELGIGMQTAGPTLGRLAASKVIEKVESGKYRVAHG